MTRLVVSVRSAGEAEAALAGGAALIDVKEPDHGPLGRAGDETIAEVIRAVAGRRPVSAALGELLRSEAETMPGSLEGLTYVKWGPAGFSADGLAWHRAFDQAVERLRQITKTCEPVAVAYADWERAQAPYPETICHHARQSGVRTFLLDTWGKDGSTLLDWLSLPVIRAWCHRCHQEGGRVAVAGSLGMAEIRILLPLRPDWIAVRGAVCQGGQRGAGVDQDKVRRLVTQIHASHP
jgi:uncharacterized protein (UPF0264 family)